MVSRCQWSLAKLGATVLDTGGPPFVKVMMWLSVTSSSRGRANRFLAGLHIDCVAPVGGKGGSKRGSQPHTSIRLFFICFRVSPVFYPSNLSISLSVLCWHPVSPSPWASVILSFLPIPIFNLSPLQWHHSCPPSPVIHSFLPPLLSISLCLFILGSFIIETWSAGLSAPLSVSLTVCLC